MGVWDLLFGQAAVEVPEDGGEGGQVEAGLDYFLNEGVGVGEGLLSDLSAGPLLAEFVGLPFEFDLGEGTGHFTLKGVDSGPYGAEIGVGTHVLGHLLWRVLIRGKRG